MEAMIDNGEEWMVPLLEFRDRLAETTIPERKKEFRDIRGRDGRVIFKKDGKLAARPYKLEVSKDMLRELLEAQELIRQEGPDTNLTLISSEELYEIRRLWRVERQDVADSLPAIYESVIGKDLDWPIDDNLHFDSEHEKLMASLCQEHDIPYGLMAQLLEEERGAYGMARRANIHKRISTILGWEWREEDEIIAERDQQLSLLGIS